MAQGIIPRTGLSLETNAGLWTGNVYLGFYGQINLHVDYRFAKHLQAGTGIGFLFTGYGTGIIVPVEANLCFLGPRGGGIILSGGAVAQAGAGQPALFPKFALRPRIMLGKKIFLDLQLQVHSTYRYECINGTNTCPNPNSQRRAGWTANPGLGLAIGGYL